MTTCCPAAAVYHCNGVQAVAYARNRYVGNSDYARTERQRYVISQIIEEVKRMDVARLTQFVKDVLPLVTHNVEETEIWDLVTKAPEILQYKICAGPYSLRQYVRCYLCGQPGYAGSPVGDHH